MLIEQSDRAEEGGSMHIVSTGVHDSVDLGREVETGVLGDRESIDIGSSQDGGPSAFSITATRPVSPMRLTSSPRTGSSDSMRSAVLCSSRLTSGLR